MILLRASYHDGALLNATYDGEVLYLYCHRNPPDPDGVEDPNAGYIIIRFDVRDRRRGRVPVRKPHKRVSEGFEKNFKTPLTNRVYSAKIGAYSYTKRLNGNQ